MTHLYFFYIIVGPKACKNVDIFLAPLLKELKELWEGVDTIDVSRPVHHPSRTFKLRAVLMWTMHDWPGLGSCSGLKTSGFGACFKCGPKMWGRHTKVLKKTVYHEHRTWLPADDPLRMVTSGKPWTEQDHRTRPIGPTPAEWRERAEKVRRRRMTRKKACINRVSILYELPYWEVSTQHHIGES